MQHYSMQDATTQAREHLRAINRHERAEGKEKRGEWLKYLIFVILPTLLGALGWVALNLFALFL